MVILPINSVINPFLYDDIVTSHIGAASRSLANRISNSVWLQSLRETTNSTPELSTAIELDDFKTQDSSGRQDGEGTKN